VVLLEVKSSNLSIKIINLRKNLIFLEIFAVKAKKIFLKITPIFHSMPIKNHHVLDGHFVDGHSTVHRMSAYAHFVELLLIYNKKRKIKN
jgi:hypothetical protein